MVATQVHEEENILELLNKERQLRMDLQNELERKDQYISALEKTANELIRQTDHASLFKMIIARASNLAGTQHGFIYVFDPDLKELEVVVGIGNYEKVVGSRVKPGKGLAGRVWQENKIVEIKDYAAWDGKLPNKDYENLHHVIGIPLISESGPSGVIGLGHFDKEKKFSPEAIANLSHFAELASIAMHNTHLHSELNKSLSSLEKEIRIRKNAEDQLKQLNENLEYHIYKRTSQLRETQKKLVENAHRAGKADIASSILHNIGNSLNSVFITMDLVQKLLKSPAFDNLHKANQLLNENKENLNQFFSNGDKGKQLLEYYLKVEEQFENEKIQLTSCIQELKTSNDHIKAVVLSQQEYVMGEKLLEPLDVSEIVGEILAIKENLFSHFGIRIHNQLKSIPPVKGQRIKLAYIIEELCKNAVDAMIDVPSEERDFVIESTTTETELQIIFNDSGTGISDENRKKAFNCGYTTKEAHYGFGLHNCANYMADMNGTIDLKETPHSIGTSVILKFPLLEIEENQK